MAVKLKLDCWLKENSHESEIHFYLTGSNVYILGFNPEYINREDLENFLKRQGYEVC